METSMNRKSLNNDEVYDDLKLQICPNCHKCHCHHCVCHQQYKYRRVATWNTDVGNLPYPF
jgi:hypothetical protein